MLLDLSPLLHGADGGAIRVAGLRAGEPAAQSDRALLTGAEEDAPAEARRYANETVCRRGVDGQFVEVPLEERVDAVLRRGGWLRCGQIAVSVREGLAERIFVRGPSLTTLKMTKEDDIARLFGPAVGHERSLGCRIHHYPARRLAIAWHDRSGALEHVCLGGPPWQEPRLGGARS
ncbi:hypothetical protein [Sorangium sp. So ce426]|uniref:hypothetical protein n=1 Tax=Sorangium sp. So ce426 TaxID=3133312 RepID=UPI003F5BEE3E